MFHGMPDEWSGRDEVRFDRPRVQYQSRHLAASNHHRRRIEAHRYRLRVQLPLEMLCLALTRRSSASSSSSTWELLRDRFVPVIGPLSISHKAWPLNVANGCWFFSTPNVDATFPIPCWKIQKSAFFLASEPARWLCLIRAGYCHVGKIVLIPLVQISIAQLCLPIWLDYFGMSYSSLVAPLLFPRMLQLAGLTGLLFCFVVLLALRALESVGPAELQAQKLVHHHRIPSCHHRQNLALVRPLLSQREVLCHPDH